ncbi:MAG: hypothetical protein IKH75_06075 [Ruminococcus sp.]|nr:hypothetical protein [Ruminococcus sp.]
MYEDRNAYHCIMLLDEYGEDGLLIEAEGFDYPRLSMFVPDAKSIFERYKTSESEMKLHDMIKDTVEKIAEPAHTGKTDFTSADMIDMDEVECLVENAILQQLAQRDDNGEMVNSVLSIIQIFNLLSVENDDVVVIKNRCIFHSDFSFYPFRDLIFGMGNA